MKQLSIWEFAFTIGGYVKANSSRDEEVSAPSEDEFEKMMSLHGGPSASIKAV